MKIITKKKAIEQIAKQTLGISTLKTRKSDALDFHEVAVWQVREALSLAYEAGEQATKQTNNH